MYRVSLAAAREGNFEKNYFEEITETFDNVMDDLKANFKKEAQSYFEEFIK